MPGTFSRIALLAFALSGCGGASVSSKPEAPPPKEASPAPVRVPVAQRFAFRNPGGMWMPGQLAAHADTLRKLGLELDPKELGDPTKAPLSAMVWLGGCSGTFVSPEGLIVTNHHCVQLALSVNSTPEHNLIEKGFYAQARAEEKSAGPTMHAYVTIKYTDVSARMKADLEALPDDHARYRALEAREKELLAECERGRPELRCRVVDFFGGGSWYLIEQIDLRDIRLVYAPARGIGNYGGEVDNWMWPRHSGDFAFYRAYVGKDGKPADHATDNVPYEPSHHLQIATTPLADGDFVMVAGFPGSTNRLATAAQVEEAASWSLPRGLGLMEQQLAVIESVTQGKPALQIKAEPMKRGLLNYFKKNQGVLDSLLKDGLVEKKQLEERDLIRWVEQNEERAAEYEPALARLSSVEAAKQQTREEDAAFRELVQGSKLLSEAVTIVRLAEERDKPDAERKPSYQRRNWARIEQASRALDKSYARELDRAIFALFVKRALALTAEQPALVEGLVARGRSPAAIARTLDKLYRKTRLEHVDTRLAWIRRATLRKLRRSRDPFIRLALLALPRVKELELKNETYQGALKVLAPKYVAALSAMHGGMLAPDANGTLRVTYGTVMPSPKGGRAFTTTRELLDKNTGTAPFDAPAPLVDAILRADYGPYTDRRIGAVPVDFMSDTDITNGNSGSSTLNARGELVGLAFDRTLDTVASDWLYLAGTARTIHVDARYMLWVMDAVDQTDPLLTELGVKPVM